MTDKVTVLTGSWDYEGGYVLGIFEDKKLAEKIQEEVIEQDNYHYVEISEVELNKFLEGKEKISV